MKGNMKYICKETLRKLCEKLTKYIFGTYKRMKIIDDIDENDIPPIYRMLNAEHYVPLRDFYQFIRQFIRNNDDPSPLNEKQTRYVKHFMICLSTSDNILQLWHNKIHSIFPSSNDLPLVRRWLVQQTNLEVIGKYSPILFNTIRILTEHDAFLRLLLHIRDRAAVVITNISEITCNDECIANDDIKTRVDTNWIRSGQIYSAGLKRIVPEFPLFIKKNVETCNKNFVDFSKRSGMFIKIY